jgi:hypothetical protein
MSSLDFRSADLASSSIDFIQSTNSLAVSFRDGSAFSSKPICRCRPVSSMLRCGVDVIVVGELGEGQEFVPIVLSFICEQPDILFQLLV